MTIRSKLLLLLGLVPGSLLGVGGAYFWALTAWQRSAGELADIHLQNSQAENLRAAMVRQTSWALDFLAGDLGSSADVWSLKSSIEERLEHLRTRARDAQESEHIEGLEETYFELAWTLERILGRPGDDNRPADVSAARARLREIADEVTDDVAVLNQYYRAEVRRSIVAATRAAHVAELATGTAVVVALAGMVLVLVLMRRWLVQPIQEVGRATESISTGDFSTRLRVSGGDEWRRLAHSINRMAASLQALNQRLRSRERLAALGEAAAYTAHNLKNPLAGIRMTAQVTLADLPTDNRTSREALEDIMAAVDRLDGWARRFLDYARPLELRPVPSDVNALVHRTVKLVSTSFRAGPVRLEVRPAPHLARAAVDPELLEQALAVLLNNACESGGDTVIVETSNPVMDEDNPRLWITVIDNGRGIAPEIRDQLFRPFVSDKSGGTGLGLAQARSIVDLHGGQIRVDSGAAGGTRFTIDLPRQGAPPVMTTHEQGDTE